jgi:hypothetical protein
VGGGSLGRWTGAPPIGRTDGIDAIEQNLDQAMDCALQKAEFGR